MKLNRLYLIVANLLMFCSLPSEAVGGNPTGDKPLEPFTFTTVWTAQAEFAGYYVAKEKGFYKDAGLDVKIQHPTLTSSVYHRLATNECDAGMFSLMSAIDIISNGTPLVNIFQTSMNNSYFIISRWGKNPAEHKRQRVAVYVSEPNYLASILNHEKKMNFRWVYYTSNINVFLSGAVDAMAAVAYHELLLLKQAGFEYDENSLYRFKDHGYNIQENGVYVKREYYQTHCDQVKRFAEASKRGWEWANTHQEEAVDIVMKYVKKEHVQTNRVIQKLMLQEILKLQVDSDSGKREYRVRPDMVKKACRLMLNSRRIDREVTYNELMGK